MVTTDSALGPQARPAPQHLFVPARDGYGPRLALVFGNHAPGGQCPYYAAGKCRHCDIGAGEGAAFTAELNRRRLAWFQEHYRQAVRETAHLVLYNSGSLLNRVEMPADVLDEILAWARSLPALRVVSLETREHVVTAEAVRRVADALGPRITGRLILGLETADDHLRDTVLVKRMPRTAVLRAVETMATVAAAVGPQRLGLTVNILVGGPGTSAHTAVEDAQATASFAVRAGHEAGLSVDLNLHPYYRSARGRTFFPAHPACPPETLAAAAAAIGQLAAASADPSMIFIGTNDEGHDTSRGEAG